MMIMTSVVQAENNERMFFNVDDKVNGNIYKFLSRIDALWLLVHELVDKTF